MSSAQVGAVLGYIRKLAGTCKDQELPDDQLLESFATHLDEAAFAALLKRHGPMVLGVCQSVLHNLHDAEDAFQAAFLLLAKKAGSIHRREAVSGWLYRVAYRLAVRSQADAARRRVHERRAATMPSADPVLDLSLREVRAILFEELENLPEPYRSPLVLCGLEEMSREEAARLLGCSVGTVKGKLERGRELLRARLRRRGLELSAGLFATVLATNFAPAQVSATLAASALKAALWLAVGKEPAAGVISAKVAALVKGATTTMLYSKLKVATALLLTVTAAFAGLGVWRHQVLAAKQPDTRQSKGQERKTSEQGRAAAITTKQFAPDSVEVTGRVLNPDGKPFRGAKLYLGYATPHGWGLPSPDADKIVAPGRDRQAKEETRLRDARATTGQDGKFHFTFATSDLDEELLQEGIIEPAVMAVADDCGPDWVAIKGKATDVTLRLVRDDVPIKGRILDEDAKPIGGVKVRVVCLAIESEKWEKKWAGPVPGQPARVTTGADGRFHLTGLGRNRSVVLRLEGPTIQYGQISALTVAPESAKKPTAQHPGHDLPATFEYLATTSRPIRGLVRDRVTGKPVAGVRMSARETQAVTYTDKDGRYQLLGCPKAPRKTGVRSYTVTAQPQNGQLYFAAWDGVDETQGLDAVTVDFNLAGGIELRGRVTDRATGKPPRRALVEYYPLFPNVHIGKIPDYPGSKDGALSSALTAPDGSYRLAALLGPGVVGVKAWPQDSYAYGLVTPKQLADLFKDGQDHGNMDMLYVAHVVGRGAILQENYSSLTLINPGEGTASLIRDIALAPAHSIRGTVHGPDGKSLAGATVMGLEGSIGGYPQTLEGGDFVVSRLTPGRTRELVFEHKEKGLAKFVTISGDRSERLIVQLEPYGSVKGRLVGKDNQAVPGNKLQMGRSGFVTAELPNLTDPEGRFSVDGLIPCQKYHLMSFREGLGWGVKFTAVSGKSKDLGNLRPVR